MPGATTKHGGPRPGAGRPPTGRPRKVKTSIAVDGDLLTWAEAEAERRDVSRNKVIEDALRAAVAALEGEPE